MSKVKKTQTNRYELLYIIPNNFTEEEAQKIHEKVKDNISQKGAEISFEDNWGKKKLAYPIKHFNHGYYNLLEFLLTKDKVNEVDHFLKFSDEVLRHQIVIKKYSNNDTPVSPKFSQEDKGAEGSHSREGVEAEKKKVVYFEDKENKEIEKDQEGPKGEQEKEKDKKAEKIEEKEEGAEEEGSKEDEKKRKDEKDKEKVDLNDLDKKLDDILNNDNLV